jgi:hypothetical protein
MEEDLKIDNEIRNFLLKKDEDISVIRDKATSYILELNSKSISEKREWFKHFTTLSSAVIGLLILFQNQAINHLYLFVGIILNLFLVIFILSFLRDTLDKESMDLQKLIDRYSTLVDNQKVLISKYFAKDNLKYEDIQQYFSESANSNDVKELQNSIEENKKKIGNRDKQFLDYTGEFIIFIFITGLFFIILAFIPNLLNGQNRLYILLVVFIFLIAAFFNFHSLIMKPINKTANFVYLKIKGTKK